MSQILDGKRIRDEILAGLAPRIAALPRKPGLVVVLVGDNPASQVYVGSKVKTCLELGMHSEKITPPAGISTEALLDLIATLNARAEIDGILVQMPLPKHIDSEKVLDAIAPEKDVDGFHPVNVGNLSIGRPGPRPCTPSGVMELLKRYGIETAGKHAVVVGRSDIVGKPMAMLLLHANATVTICHSRTKDLEAECRRADILVGAIGRPAMLTKAHMKPGAVMIDVGINELKDRAQVVAIFGEDSEKTKAFDKRGSVLVGDMHPYDAAELSSYWTPVPGGVGPLTIAQLMANTVESAERRQR
ncbi:MAG: bifunctional 5,10-methylenetetrahydrofolate dehydrogenase/5,10-methenyltetrahydrofolate cyclohydrolase [Acidobacteria bacterium]|nr:bifunctional 5,10-methylenetetrahydrofolate dehydrogenase/5,10-methenyltetrahydrofolate cyclohydrolase [Acidobacteriota bacterium]MBM3763760.1 bifunctional 5,10-methylenetetrahydrofolate dehydrogenase/5,10-methenyltetrahydrofolate cyclohydrolase [Acidobacteriota bacterium]